MNKKLIIAILIAFSYNYEIQSLSYTNSNIITALSAISSGYIAKWIQKAAINDIYRYPKNYYLHHKDEVIRNSLIVAAITGAVAKLWTSSYTPAPLLNYIKKKLEDHKQWTVFQLIFNNNFEGDVLLETVEQNFATSPYPVIKCFNDINDLNSESKELVSYLNNILQTDDAEQSVRNEAAVLLQKLDGNYFDKIHVAMITIKSHPQFSIQKMAFENEMQRRELAKLRNEIAWQSLQNSLNNLRQNNLYINYSSVKLNNYN